MLAAPNVRKPSRIPTMLIAVALASALAYFAFFRPKGETAAAPAAPPVAAAPAPRLAPLVEAPKPPEPVVEAPVEAPKKLERKPAATTQVAVAFPPAPAPRSLKSEVDDLIAENRWRDARAKIAAAFATPVPDAERIEMAQQGIRINQELLQNRADDKDVELYEIQQGDTLESIAKRFKGLSGVKGAIMYVNNYKENALLRAGRKVRVTKGSWSIIVDKSLFREWVCYEGCPFKGYTITIGAAPSKETPVAKFVVGGKNPKPAWWPPADVKISTKGPIPYGDPQNPLGEWWISLEHDIHHGIGIHGTNDPGSIGSKASNGCIRMLNEEVVEVAALAFKGMVVSIVE
jgi:hypothetical protein